MSISLSVGECTKYGAVALFGDGDGTLLIQGSSWVRCGSKVSRNGFDNVKKFDIPSNPRIEDKEKLFLLCRKTQRFVNVVWL